MHCALLPYVHVHLDNYKLATDNFKNLQKFLGVYICDYLQALLTIKLALTT